MNKNIPSEERSVIVRVPGTSANIGPGFDAFGMAFNAVDRKSVV